MPLFYVNAFPDRPFSGNPAAVCVLDSWLDDERLRKVAAENNLSATAFLVARQKAYEIRWFTRACELKLCGHATLASGYVVMKLLQPQLASIDFLTSRMGTVTVRQDRALLIMQLPARIAEHCRNVPDTLTQAVGATSPTTDVLEVNQTYVVIFEDESSIQALRPDTQSLEQLHPYAVSVSAPGKKSDIVSRYFAPAYGIPEDPVTGSSHCFLTPYWTQRLGKARVHSRQLSQRGGELWCQMAGDCVILEGKAVLTMQGYLEI